MTQPIAAPAPAVTAPAPVSGVMPSLESRVASVNAAMDQAFAEANPGGPPEPTDAVVPADLTPGKAAPTDALTASVEVEVPPTGVIIAPDPEAVAAQQRAAERQQRLAALSTKTREQVDRKAQQAASEKMARDYAAAQARAEEAEKVAAGRVDVSKLDAASFLGLAERQGIKPDDLIRFISESMTSPGKVAEAAALQATKTAYDPKLAALESKLAAQDARIAAYEQAQQAHAEEQQAQHAQQSFLHLVSQSSARAPIAARLLASDPQDFLDMANIAAARVPGMGAEALLDAVEELLDGAGRKNAQKIAALYGLTTTPSQPSAPVQPTTTRGAAKPNTVSNSLAQGRTALVDDQDFARLTIEERAAILKRS